MAGVPGGGVEARCAVRRGGTVAPLRGSEALRPDRVPLIAATSDNFFDALGVKAARYRVSHGRRPGRRNRGQPSLLAARPGGDPGVLSRELRVGNADVRVIGILPAGFGGVNRGLAVDLFVPIQTGYGVLRFGALTDRRNNEFEVLGRLRAGADTDAARREVEAALRTLESGRPVAGPGSHRPHRPARWVG